jgi:hypothetical protein
LDKRRGYITFKINLKRGYRGLQEPSPFLGWTELFPYSSLFSCFAKKDRVGVKRAVLIKFNVNLKSI